LVDKEKMRPKTPRAALSRSGPSSENLSAHLVDLAAAHLRLLEADFEEKRNVVEIDESSLPATSKRNNRVELDLLLRYSTLPLPSRSKNKRKRSLPK
jgi:hypothetical protein